MFSTLNTPYISNILRSMKNDYIKVIKHQQLRDNISLLELRVCTVKNKLCKV